MHYNCYIEIWNSQFHFIHAFLPSSPLAQFFSFRSENFVQNISTSSLVYNPQVSTFTYQLKGWKK